MPKSEKDTTLRLNLIRASEQDKKKLKRLSSEKALSNLIGVFKAQQRASKRASKQDKEKIKSFKKK